MKWKKEQKREKKSLLQKKAPKPVKSPGKLKVEIQYRDAGNYKTLFDHEIDLKKFPDAAKLKKENEITMGQYGTLKEDDFFWFRNTSSQLR